MDSLNIKWKPTPKQLEAFNILEDKTTTELFFGGAAGGGKSYLGCVWIIVSCLKYPGSRWLMGRAVLKSLKESTLLTFFNICKEWGLTKDVHYHYNSIEGVIRFYNESEIYLKDLFAYPSDPEFDNLGSTEYTGVFIDEGSQINAKAKNIVLSRIRYRLEEFNLIPKLLITSNPSKNFLYYEFYKLFKENNLPPYRKFIPALVGDNPYISPHYSENLKKLDKNSQERLLYGNFEYDDDPSRLFEYDDILDLFTNTPEKSEKKYLTVDVARFGDDKTVIIYWEGLFIKRIWELTKYSTKETENLILAISEKNNIPRSHIVVDEDGVGGGVVDHIDWVKGFVNNSKPIDTENRDNNITNNYSNLKSQCYFKLADYVKLGKIGIGKEYDDDIKEKIIEELEQIKGKNAESDGKLAVVGKDVIKEKIGRSPDFADAIMMRMYFELKPEITCCVEYI